MSVYSAVTGESFVLLSLSCPAWDQQQVAQGEGSDPFRKPRRSDRSFRLRRASPFTFLFTCLRVKLNSTVIKTYFRSWAFTVVPNTGP